MQIKIKDDAKAYLEAHVDTTGILLLTTDDGSNRYSTLGGSCAIGNKFQVVALTEPDPAYQVPIDNADGYQLFTSKDDAIYLGNGLVLDRAHNQLALHDDSGDVGQCGGSGDLHR